MHEEESVFSVLFFRGGDSISRPSSRGSLAKAAPAPRGKGAEAPRHDALTNLTMVFPP